MPFSTDTRMKIALIFGLLFPIFISAQTFVDDELWHVAQPTECLIFMGQPDLRPAFDIRGKEAKGNFVYGLLKDHARNTQKDVCHYLSSKEIDYQRYIVVNAVYARLQWEQIERIAQMPHVRAIVANGILEEQWPETDVLSLREDEVTWGIEMINADSVWKLGFRGQDVVLAGEDTGVKWDLPAIENAYRGYDGSSVDHNYNWHDAIHEINPMHNDSIVMPSNNPCGLDTSAPCDDHGHGTHTVGTMVGEDGDMKIGVAPDAEWIACRCMERGYGTLQTYLECFEFFLAPTDLNGEDPRPELAPDAINNSWGCPLMEGCNPSNYAIMEAAVSTLKAAGIVVVVSAGNAGPSCSSIRNPAAIFENSFSVGASDDADQLTSFSSRGPVLVDSSFRIKPDVVAPGRRVLSQLPDSSYAAWDGTSMAGPHVAGLVALILSANPGLRGEVDVIEEIITSTAIRKFMPEDSCDVNPMTVPNNSYGYGRIDALAAVEKALGLITTSEDDPAAAALTCRSPFVEGLEITSTEGQPLGEVRIYSGSGMLVYSEKGMQQNHLKINTTDWPGGIYVVRVKQKSRLMTMKAIKPVR